MSRILLVGLWYMGRRPSSGANRSSLRIEFLAVLVGIVYTLVPFY